MNQSRTINNMESADAKKKYLFLDIETNGIGRFSPRPTQRAVQISWIFDGKENDHLICDVTTISTDASYPCQHISLDILHERGILFNKVWELLKNDLLQADVIVAHNVQFDVSVLIFELRTRGFDYQTVKWLRYKKKYCTMRRATEYCAIRFDDKQDNEYKWPRLAELYQCLFGHEPAQAQLHNSLYDCRILHACWKRGNELKIFK